MLAAAVIFSPFFFHFVETCLKINYSTPPKCECKSLALDSSNMQQNIGTSSFYPNISLHSVQSPIISIDDCALTAHCNNENYDLVGFDPLKATMCRGVQIALLSIYITVMEQRIQSASLQRISTLRILTKVFFRRHIIDGCVVEEIWCVRVDDLVCEAVGITAKTDSGTYQIEDLIGVSGVSAMSILVCGSNGMHSHYDIIDIKEISCSYEMCS
ncbi:hypothetical protein GCK72_012600 [Caenorhabditis remanei]|uniref:Phlebovirus glycoprotein G2 fusion domain-containing protein n=1 Tax=Caenorhabditis remanei TaxID=31234 RepID=A0A6A5GLF3_CAERE|nr:hypothetical protein GCK72_012600 [Caenorhabditis remanei]KAF1756147.1 hypothetical protein GCK72_012600 [Caenorhabditis remanei]